MLLVGMEWAVEISCLITSSAMDRNLLYFNVAIIYWEITIVITLKMQELYVEVYRVDISHVETCLLQC